MGKQRVVPDNQIKFISTVMTKLGMDSTVNPNDNGALIESMLKVIHVLVDNQNLFKDEKEKLAKEVENLKTGQREVEDDRDCLWQRNLKGNVIINSPNIPGRSLETVIKSDTTLEAERSNITEHAIALVNEYYGVEVLEEDLQACHRLKGTGSILLRFSNRRNGSAYSKLVTEIKKGGKAGRQRSAAATPELRREIKLPNLFICFHLTKRRGLLVKHLKALKRNKQINNFSSDQNGMVFLQRVRDGEWEPLTRKWDDNPDIKTFLPEEIDQRLQRSG